MVETSSSYWIKLGLAYFPKKNYIIYIISGIFGYIRRTVTVILAACRPKHYAIGFVERYKNDGCGLQNLGLHFENFFRKSLEVILY